jgi:hypothetical protein
MRGSVTRSVSAPPDTSQHKRSDTDDEDIEFPALIPDAVQNVVQDSEPSWWTRDIYPTRSSRHSRASSIVSTRTRFSTTTLDEVRSIEISAGGHTYRISRDGSQISDASAPPPYSGPSIYDEGLREDVVSDMGEDDPHRSHQPETVDHEPRKRVRIVLPGEEDMAPDPGMAQDEPAPDRALTKADLYQIMLDLPFQLKRVLGIRSSGHSPSSSVEEITLKQVQPMEGKEINNHTGDRPMHSSQQHEYSQVIAESSISGLTNPQVRGMYEDGFHHMGSIDEPSGSKSSTDTIRQTQYEQDEIQSVHMTVGDLNELSLLYNGVIRDLDKEHRRKLHERDKEMERLRSMLDEKDIVYRQQLRGKDFVIEDLRGRLTRQEEMTEEKLEKARNEVEDIWEKRWKAQEGHLMERIKRAEQSRP